MREKNYDILAISESWLNSTTTNAEVEIAGYKITRLDRTRKLGEGCASTPDRHLKLNVLRK